MSLYMASPMQRRVVFDGQSLNGNPFGASTGAWPYKVMNGSGIYYAEVWIGGLSWTNLEPTRVERVNPLGYSALKTVLVMMGGTTGLSAGQPASAGYTAMKNYADGARAAGFDYIVNFTVPPSTTISGANETERGTLNTSIKGNAEGKWDAIVDLTALPHIESDPTNTTYYVDGTHLTVAAHTEIADAARTPILNLIP